MPGFPVIVLKFGGSVLADEDRLPDAVHEIYRWVRDGYRVVAVVSALGKTTDRLLGVAREFCAEPDPGAVAALLATGEATSVALLCLALDRAGVPATALDPARVGLCTDGPVLDSRPRALDTAAIARALADRPVAVLPGFIGRTADGATSLLGRGGSDYTALFVAQQLGARCRLVKDVDGLYERDPSLPGTPPRRFAAVSWDDALRLDGRIVQHKAVRFARDHALGFEVAAASAGAATVVGHGPTTLGEEAHAPASPRRVGLLGLGTVGLGVYRELAARPELFEVTGIAIRNIRKAVSAGAPPELLTTDPWAVVGGDCDLVIEAIGGRSPASELIAAALEAGRDVVTANKAVIAHDGPQLAERASNSARIRFSAAVGGGTPVLEAIRAAARRGPLRAVEGVVNGTTNFVLDRVAQGSSLEDAVRAAQAAGFAELDPTTDLDGTDASHKLAIIAAEAFGVNLDPEAVERTGILELDPLEVRAAAAAGRSVRLVASATWTSEGVVAEVGPRTLSAAHSLALVRGEENRVVIHPADGPAVVVHGKGAGRWPTTESVMADVFEIVRERRGGAAIEEDLERSAAR